MRGQPSAPRDPRRALSPLYYVDASALVKLVRDEPESAALDAFLGDADLVSCELVLTEVPRAMRRAAPDDPALRDLLVTRAEETLDTVALTPLDRAILIAAGALDEPSLRTLDAIHLTAAIDASPLDGFVTYGERQAAVARMAGLPAISPA